MKYPLLVPVIGHGATDIIDYPIKSILYNIFSAIIINKLSYKERKRTLIFTSIYHLANDFKSKYNYILSTCMHFIMIKKPIIAKCYFCFYHTPLHYIRQIYINNKWIYKFLIGYLTSIIANYAINNNIEDYMERYYGKLWWISPIIVHIFLTSYQYNNFILYYKNNRFINYIIKNIMII